MDVRNLKLLSYAELSAEAEAFDADVARTPDIDHFCSSSYWILPAQAAFAPSSRPFILRMSSGWVPLMVQPGHYGITALPLEAMWGMGCPLIGPDPTHLIDELAEVLMTTDLPWHALYLTGLQPDGLLPTLLRRRFQNAYQMGLGTVTRRRVASLEGGYDGFLSRRSPNFRAKLRSSMRKARDLGIHFEHHFNPTPAQATALYERIVALEERSWKGERRIGINHGAMFRFYQDMVIRLAARQSLRVGFLRHEDQDIAFVFGGLQGTTYRGLQVSYDHKHKSLTPGNLAQAHLIQSLIAEGVTHYDLGMDMPYKRRWAETEHSTALFALLKN